MTTAALRSATLSARAALAALLVLFLLLAFLAPLIAPQNVLDPAAIDVLDAETVPGWAHWFGTDMQGRDMLSAILYGLRISIAVALVAMIMSCILGSLLGAAAGAFGGWTDAIVMRAADLQLAFPALLTALLIEGVIAAATGGRPDAFGFWTVAFSIGLTYWAQYARAVRAAAIAESTKDYVLAARMSGMSTWRLLTRELLPNVAVPLAPIAAVNFACAIMAEATLSFLGIGLQPSHPSLGTLLRLGNDAALSLPWILAFPAAVLAILTVSANLFGDEISRGTSQ